MELRALGGAGRRAGGLSFGTMPLGNEADQATSKQIVDSLDAGGNFTDTADLYQGGIGRGILTGKDAAATSVPADTRLGPSDIRAQRRLPEPGFGMAQAVANKSPTQVALNWVICSPGFTSPILSARTVAQLEDNLGAEGCQPDTEQVASIDRVGRQPLPYPHDMHRMIDAM